ncbi:DUF2145 domain-containing protein [Ralstonia solanacearum]|uniref:DUF2145 domain-containing protein n=1 Tax=Ralstonia pseudosolanacearum TaxID=1310165 RepID=UPI000C9F22EF|nr:DUF2145 domain-containing protein [Ralstonia pseudosolanacearum]AUS43377.1 DUF2145 domain-containing protein [Ralstonia solanacearum]
MLLMVLMAGTARASGLSAWSTASNFCDRTRAVTARQQDRLLRFAAVVHEELEQTGGSVALVSRSGLDLSRFRIRYSHAAIAWRSEDGMWAARQLYYACDEGRPRLYDQGIAGFAVGIDSPSHGYVSIVRLPLGAADTVRLAALDNPRALRLLAATYSANAYPFSTRYQNCNQWVVELLASAWGDIREGEELRERAQDWLRRSGYTPEPVDVDSHLLMFASTFVPLVHLDDHPEQDVFSMKLEVSLPSTLEAFIRKRFPESERIELCYDAKRVVVHHGWEPIADGCEPRDGDRVVSFD